MEAIVSQGEEANDRVEIDIWRTSYLNKTFN